ncbi:MAG: hypothetical protein NTU67_03000 [Gemmatimonadetes bacterium]|nr:hypothetical protein [Gemmatimonadota bacterium]
MMMQQRHLLPDEIDQLLDSESSVDVAPLLAHLDACSACVQQLADARVVCDTIEQLQHFAPSPRFTASVMAQVRVVEPWHVALTTSAQRLIPASRPMRVVMLASGSLMALGLSAGAVWLSTRPDMTLYAAGLAASRVLRALLDATGTIINDTFGQTALDALRSGSVSRAGLGGVVVVTAIGVATIGLRAAATSARRARE